MRVLIDNADILVAEDIESNYMLIKAMLRPYRLTRVKNGAEAVAMAKTNEYHAILMDIRMPVMDGLEAVRLIRDFDKRTPIIAVTANAFDSARIEAMQIGCNAFISKPLRKKELEEVVGKEINKYVLMYSDK